MSKTGIKTQDRHTLVIFPSLVGVQQLLSKSLVFSQTLSAITLRPHGLCSGRLCFETLSPHSFSAAPFIVRQPFPARSVMLTRGWSFWRSTAKRYQSHKQQITDPNLPTSVSPQSVCETRLNSVILIPVATSISACPATAPNTSLLWARLMCTEVPPCRMDMTTVLTDGETEAQALAGKWRSLDTSPRCSALESMLLTLLLTACHRPSSVLHTLSLMWVSGIDYWQGLPKKEVNGCYFHPAMHGPRNTHFH